MLILKIIKYAVLSIYNSSIAYDGLRWFVIRTFKDFMCTVILIYARTFKVFILHHSCFCL